MPVATIWGALEVRSASAAFAQPIMHAQFLPASCILADSFQLRKLGACCNLTGDDVLLIPNPAVQALIVHSTAAFIRSLAF
jgi:hypothetical protein